MNITEPFYTEREILEMYPIPPIEVMDEGYRGRAREFSLYILDLSRRIESRELPDEVDDTYYVFNYLLQRYLADQFPSVMHIEDGIVTYEIPEVRGTFMESLMKQYNDIQYMIPSDLSLTEAIELNRTPEDLVDHEQQRIGSYYLAVPIVGTLLGLMNHVDRWIESGESEDMLEMRSALAVRNLIEKIDTYNSWYENVEGDDYIW